MTIIRVFQRPDGSEVLVYYWPDDNAMQVSERVAYGSWGVPLKQVGNEDQ